MKHDARKYLIDIQQSIALVEDHISGIVSFAIFEKDLKTIDAVERRLGIIGEALWKAQKLDATINITDDKKIIGLRHILVHDYDLIDAAILWNIIHKNLPLLKQEVTTLLQL